MSGFDWPALLQMLPPEFDRSRLIRLARHYELGLIEGAAELLPKPKS